MRTALLLLAALQCAGCATHEALFAEYERPCAAEVVRPVPALAHALAVAAEPSAPPPPEAVEPAVFFDYRSAALDDDARATLARILERLAARPEAHLFLRAQTDWRGSDAVNEALAERRLAAVREALLADGLAPGRLRGVGIGERETMETRDTRVMDAARRVDIEFVDAHGRPLPVHLPDAGARA